MIPQRIILGYSGSSSASYSYALFTWGFGTNGALGTNSVAHVSVPVQVGVQTDWVSVSGASGGTVLSLKLNGTLWAWGSNTVTSAGNIGDGTAIAKSSPVQVGSLSDWAQIASGGANCGSFAIKTDGTLWSWGTGSYGSLGHNNTTAYSSPVQIGALTTWSKIAASWKSVGAIKTDGTLWGWGLNNSGQLGDGSTTARSSPIQIGNLTNWVQVACGYRARHAIKTDGTLWAWGRNTEGAIGDGTVVDKSSPVQIGALTNWSYVISGVGFTIAVKTDGTLWAWGQDSKGVLGLNNTTYYSSPVQVGALTDWGNFNTGQIGGTGISNTFNIKTNGALWGWGNEAYGSIGNNAEIDLSSPVQIGGATDWFFVDHGKNSAAGIRKIDNNAGYALWMWGDNSRGQLGDGTVVNTSSPVQIGSLNEWSKLSEGQQHSHAIKTDGTLWSWGRNTRGKLGTNEGTLIERSSPVQVGNLADWAFTISGFNGSTAIKTNGTLWTWGLNYSGQLGLGDVVDRSSPVQVGALTDWSVVSYAGYSKVAIKTDGTLWGWGGNNQGELGLNNTTSYSSPVQVGALTTWKSIASARATTHAIKTDGTLWTWGRNLEGQLGDGTVVNKSSPVQIGALTTWDNVKCFSDHTLAIKTDGTLWAWGENVQGELGLNNTTNYSSPIQIGALTNWSDFGSGYAGSGNYGSSFAIKTDGTLWVWGDNGYGQLALRDLIDRSSPVQLGTGAGWNTVAFGKKTTGALRRPTIATGTTSGYLFASGNNNLSLIPRLGNDNTINYSSLTQVGTSGSNLKNNWKSIAGYTGGAGVNTLGELWAWGYNVQGQLGINNTTNYSFPVQVGALTDWSIVRHGSNSTFSLKTDGTLWAWGNNANGQLGFGDIVNRSSPVQVGTLTNWTYLGVGRNEILAIKTDGTLWACGKNSSGQLGLGDIINRSSPVQVGTLTTWYKVNSSNGNTTAIKTDGTLWAWGGNASGQLGDGTVVGKSSPVQIGALTDWVEIRPCTTVTAAIKTDGTLWTWGGYSGGALGDGSTSNRSSPVQVGTLTDWSKLSHQHNQNAFGAIKTGGTLWMWGMDNSGSIPNGVVQNESSPVQIGHYTDWLEIAVGQNRSWFIRKAYQ